MSKNSIIAEDISGKVALLMGNEAIARGALEASVSVAAGYPGTPATEIIESLFTISESWPEIYVEWSTNEKVAFEVAYAASMCDVRGIAVMKHVGLNVALDSVMTAGYSGARGGLVLVSADDPNCYSSQNEQDNRFLARHALIPVFEPSDVQEAKDMTKFAFDFSEEYKTLVMIRTTTRLSHSRGNVIFGNINKDWKKGEFDFDIARWTFLPNIARTLRKEQLKRFKEIEEITNNLPFNWLKINNGSKLGIISSGISNAFVEDYLKALNLADEVSLLKIGITHPPPRKLIIDLLSNVEKVLIVEELEPFIELYVNAISNEINRKIQVFGKDLVPRFSEITPDRVLNALAKFTGKSLPAFSENQTEEEICVVAPPRPPVLCPGCGHSAFFYALKVAISKISQKPSILSGDIGCYTLGYFKPLEAIHTAICMGGSIGLANGFSKVTDAPVFAIIGDSTFFHAGIPALINAVFNNSKIIVTVLDNYTTAMTGLQVDPGTGKNLTGTTQRILIEEVAKGVGVKFVRVVDPYELGVMIETIKEAFQHDGPSLIVARHLCSLLEVREKRKRGEKIIPYQVMEEKCTSCHLCVSNYSCPALSVNEEKIVIDEMLCTGCGVCAKICPESAIVQSTEL